MKIGKLSLVAILYFCIATVVAEAAPVSAVWARGGVTREKLIQLLAIAHDIDLATMWDTMEGERQPTTTEQVSYDDVLDGRAVLSVDLDLREIGTDKGLNDIRQLEDMLAQERDRYSHVKASFEQELQKLRQGAVDSSLQEVQRQLESVDSRLAKDQILRILDGETIDPEIAMNFVVTMFKGMPLDKRKKIVAEFKNEEVDQLHEILKQIRRGVPESTLIRDTRDIIKEFSIEDSEANRSNRRQ